MFPGTPFRLEHPKRGYTMVAGTVGIGGGAIPEIRSISYTHEHLRPSQVSALRLLPIGLFENKSERRRQLPTRRIPRRFCAIRGFIPRRAISFEDRQRKLEGKAGIQFRFGRR